MDLDEFFETPNSHRKSHKHSKRPKKDKVKRPTEQPKPQPLTCVTFIPRSPAQRAWKKALETSRLTFGVGPAGTGKTIFAVSRAIDLLLDGTVKRILLSRPAVEAEEKLGFLPGGIEDKLAPYLRPLYDAIHEKLGDTLAGTRQLEQWLKTGVIEITPIGFMRGRTFKHCAIVLDEAQNATAGQLKMALTRIGVGSYMFLTGDPEQSDLLNGLSGFAPTLEKLASLAQYPIVRFAKGDVQRDPIVADLVRVL